MPQVRTRVPGPKMIRFQCIFLIIPASFYGQECLSASKENNRTSAYDFRLTVGLQRRNWSVSVDSHRRSRPSSHSEIVGQGICRRIVKNRFLKLEKQTFCFLHLKTTLCLLQAVLRTTADPLLWKSVDLSQESSKM